MPKKTKVVALPDDCLRGLDGQLMIMAAHRYCLGRMSYIVSSGIDWLTKWWAAFDRSTQLVILRDTIEAIQDDRAGADSDRLAWQHFAQDRLATLTPDDQHCVRQSVCQDKPWPLNQTN